MPVKPRGTAPGGGQPPPGPDKSQELLDAINALAYGVTSLAESVPQLCETLEVVSKQFAVLIASEAQRRSITAETLVEQTLIGLGQRVFGKRR